MQLKDFLTLKDDAACQSIHHVYYDDSQNDIKSLKKYLKNRQEVSTLFYKKQIEGNFDDLKTNERAIILTAGVDSESKEFSKVEFIIARQNGASMEAEMKVSILVSDGEPEGNEYRVKTQDELVDCLRKELKKYTGSRVYGYHIFPVVWRLFHEHVFEQKSEEKKLPFVLVELATSLDEADLSKASQNVEECFELFKKIKGKKEPYSSHVFILPFYINHGEYFCEGNIDEEEWDRRPLSNGEAVEKQSYFKTNYFLDPENKEKSREMIQYAFERYFNAEVLEVLKEYTKTYVKKKTENQYYWIKRYLNDEGTEFEIYKLKINYINLRLISTGGKLEKPDIGFLIISADNYDYFDTKTINRINQFGRRVYAPFFSINHTSEEHAYDIYISAAPLKEEKRNQPAKFNFSIMTAIDRLLRSFFCFNDEDKILENIDKDKNELSLQRILDDRMFVVSNYRFTDSDFNHLSDGFKGDEFKDYHSNSYLTKKQIYDFQKELYKYIYIDNGYPSSQSPISVRGQLNRSVYDRWMDSGTLYAVSQHSMLMLTTPKPPTYLFTYFYTEYLEMLLLVLTQRVGILSFSMEAGKLAKVARDKNDKIGNDTLSLQERYVVFKNQFLLPELSSQEQTIEMYDLLQQNLYIHRQKEMLDDQIQSLYEINQTKSNNIREKENAKFNFILFFFTVWTFIASYNDFRTSYQGDGEKVGPITWEDWISRPQPDLWTFYRLLLAIIIILILCKMLKKFPGFLKNAIQKIKKWYKRFPCYCYRCLKRLLTYFENRICKKEEGSEQNYMDIMEINKAISELGDNKGQVFDGFHTFDELYYHRMVLFAVICRTYRDKAWKSRQHEDGSMYEGFFIVGLSTPEGDFAYHYKLDDWDLFEVEELDHAPAWDGHVPEDVTRLLSLVSDADD